MNILSLVSFCILLVNKVQGHLYPSNVEDCIFDSTNNSFSCNINREFVCNETAKFSMHFLNDSCASKRLWHCSPHKCDSHKSVKTVMVPIPTTITTTETCTETVIETLPPVTTTVTNTMTNTVTDTLTTTVTNFETSTKSVLISEVITETITNCPRSITIDVPTETTLVPSSEEPCPEETTPVDTRAVTIDVPTETTLSPSSEEPCPEETTSVDTRVVTVDVPTETTLVPSSQEPCPEETSMIASSFESTSTTFLPSITSDTSVTPEITLIYKRFYKHRYRV